MLAGESRHAAEQRFLFTDLLVASNHRNAALPEKSLQKIREASQVFHGAVKHLAAALPPLLDREAGEIAEHVGTALLRGQHRGVRGAEGADDVFSEIPL